MDNFDVDPQPIGRGPKRRRMNSEGVASARPKTRRPVAKPRAANAEIIKLPVNNNERAGNIFLPSVATDETTRAFEPSLIGFFDSIANGCVEGWAFDKRTPANRVSLVLHIDGAFIRTFTASSFREDLLASGYSDGWHAFSVEIPKRYFNDTPHEIAITYSATDEVVPGGPIVTLLEARIVEEIRGWTDTINEREVSGWVLDAGAPLAPLTVELVADGIAVGQVVADTFRDDLKELGVGNGECGFRFSTPLSLLDDVEHEVLVRVLDTELIVPGERKLKAKNDRPYKNFQEYLRWALYYHEIHPPFSENDKAIIADMICLSNYYFDKYQAVPQDKLVSVIMPTYNRASLIREAINSVLSQTYQNWELIVVDDCSTDATEAVVRSYNDARIKFIRCHENRGCGAARAIGMENAKGQYFAYLDSDNTWDPRFIQIMICHMVQNVGFYSAYCAQILHHNDSTEPRKSIRYSPFNRSLLENANYIDINCFAHSRALYEKFGGFRSDIRSLEDWDLIIRYTADVFPASLPCLLSHYFVGKASSQLTFSERYVDTVKKIRTTLAPQHFTTPKDDKVLNTNYIIDTSFFKNAGSIRKYWEKRFVSIIIPSFESAEYLDVCLWSINRFTPPGSFEIIIVDNGSTGPVLEVLGKYRGQENVKILHNHINFGYSRAINQGIACASAGSDLIFLNNDVVVTEGWLEAFWEVRDTVVDAELIVPRQTLLPNTTTMDVHVPRCNPLLEVDVNLSAHHWNVLDPLFDERRGFMELSFAAFFCVYVTRKCIDLVGLLDEKNGRHYRSDAVYTDMVRLLTAGKMIYTPHAKLYHFLQKSTNHLKSTDKEMYELMFVQNKWSEDDPLRGIF